jgi:hypothetical protein
MWEQAVLKRYCEYERTVMTRTLDGYEHACVVKTVPWVFWQLN